MGGASATGGMPGAGTSQGGGAAGATSGSGGRGGGTGGSGSCQKGQVAGNEVLVIGDSFIAINHAITNEVERLARAAGALG